MSTPILALKRPPSIALFIVLFSSLFSVIFNYTLSIMASPYIASDLGGSTDIAIYTVSFFALGNALGIPLGKGLLAKIGTTRYLVLVSLLVGLFSLTCALAPTYFLFNVSRFFQGFVCGPIYALCYHLFRTLEPSEKSERFSSITLMLFSVGPVIGASWGGWIAYQLDWRVVFYLNIPVALFFAFYLGWRLRGFDSMPVAHTPFDVKGYFLYFIAVFCLGCAVIMGQELDWQRSSLILTLLGIGGFSLLLFILWEIHHPTSFMRLRLLKNPVLTFALINLAVLFSAYFGMVILLALWLNLWVNYTPDWIGILIGTMAIAGLFPLFIVEKQLRRIDNRIYLAIAILFLAISCLHTMIFNVDINFGRIAASRILAGFGLALFMAPIFRLCFHGLPEESALYVQNIFQAVRALSSGLGASFYATIWLRRQVFYHDRLGSQLTAFDPQTQEFFANAAQVGLKDGPANAKLEFYLQRQATSLALDDCFYLMAWILIGLLLSFGLTLFLRRSSFISK